MEVQLQSLRQMSLGNNRFLDLFVGLHRCSRIPCCIQILRFETYSQAAFRWIQTVLNFRDSCCRIIWWHINNLAADGSGRQELQIVVLNSARLFKLGTWSGIECCSYLSVVTINHASLSLSLWPGTWWIFPHNTFVRANEFCSLKMAFSILKMLCCRGLDQLYPWNIQQFSEQTKLKI